MPAWLTDPHGYILSFAVAGALIASQTVIWVLRGRAQQGGLKARVLDGMQKTTEGARWLRHPRITAASTVVLLVVFGWVFNARF
ncbi:MAG: hypothetical protein ABI334_07800 [Candidatus Dormiibacterota bacterium]